VVETLHTIAVLGITVVAVIHQPRAEIFDSFDEVLMLAPGGITTFFGHQDNLETYFKDMGFIFDTRYNPADVLMDIISGRGKKQNEKPYQVSELVKAWADKAEKTYALSEFDPNINGTIKKICKGRCATFFRQILLVHNRSLLQQYRALNTLALECAVALLAGKSFELQGRPRSLHL